MHKRKYKTCEEFIKKQNDDKHYTYSNTLQGSEERCTCWSLKSSSESCLDCQMFDAIHEDMGDK